MVEGLGLRVQGSAFRVKEAYGLVLKGLVFKG